MKLLLFTLLICIGGVLACHPSCLCNDPNNPYKCTGCKRSDQGCQVSQPYQRSCPCPAGYYTNTLYPFECKKYQNVDLSGNANDLIMESCHVEIGLKTRYIIVETDCDFVTEFHDNIQLNYVVSSINLNFNNANICNDCKSAIFTKVQYLSPQATSFTYTDLDLQYVINGSNGSKIIKIPLINVYDLALQTFVTSVQIVQRIKLQLLIGHSQRFVRQHRWDLWVYTDRNEVQLFQIDVDIQTTSGCDECVVVADLDIVGKIMDDNTYSSVKAAPYCYQVGDHFYASIKFADPTYTKYLKFIKLYFKNDVGQIFDFSSLVTHSWSNNALNIDLPLPEPSLAAIIQINMLIDPNSSNRFLQSAQASASQTDQSQAVKTQFQNVLVQGEGKTATPTPTTTQSSSGNSNPSEVDANSQKLASSQAAHSISLHYAFIQLLCLIYLL